MNRISRRDTRAATMPYGLAYCLMAYSEYDRNKARSLSSLIFFLSSLSLTPEVLSILDTLYHIT